MLPCQQGLAQLDAGREAVVTSVDLRLDALVVVHQQLNGGHVPTQTNKQTKQQNHRQQYANNSILVAHQA